MKYFSWKQVAFGAFYATALNTILLNGVQDPATYGVILATYQVLTYGYDHLNILFLLSIMAFGYNGNERFKKEHPKGSYSATAVFVIVWIGLWWMTISAGDSLLSPFFSPEKGGKLVGFVYVLISGYVTCLYSLRVTSFLWFISRDMVVATGKAFFRLVYTILENVKLAMQQDH